MRRIPQPPVNPALRAREIHRFWPGCVAVLVGVITTLCGARHLTGVNTTDDDPATETQLIKAIASSGLQYPNQIAPPPPPNLENVADPDAAMARWAQEQADRQPPAWKLRVDLSAQAACPT